MGLSAELRVETSGIPPVGYQWRKDGASISGANGPVYAFPNVQSSDAGTYSVIITNLSGVIASSNAVLAVLPIVTTQQPEDARQHSSGRFKQCGGDRLRVSA